MPLYTKCYSHPQLLFLHFTPKKRKQWIAGIEKGILKPSLNTTHLNIFVSKTCNFITQYFMGWRACINTLATYSFLSYTLHEKEPGKAVLYWQTDTVSNLGSQVKHHRARLVFGWVTVSVCHFLVIVFRDFKPRHLGTFLKATV